MQAGSCTESWGGVGEEKRWEPGQNHGQKAQAQRAQHAGFCLYSPFFLLVLKLNAPGSPQIDLVPYPQSIMPARTGVLS